MTRSERVVAAVCRREVFALLAVSVICLVLVVRNPGVELRPENLPRLGRGLHLSGEVEPFADSSEMGYALSDGHRSITTGLGRRKQVLAAFGPPPRISLEGSREMWCYRLPPNPKGERLHLTVCFDGWLALDELTHFTLGNKKWVIFDEPNYSASPQLQRWDI